MPTVKSFRPSKSATYIMYVYLIIVILAFGGWVANIVKVFGADTITGMELVRIVGIVLAPLGSILGFL